MRKEKRQRNWGKKMYKVSKCIDRDQSEESDLKARSNYFS